MASSSSVQFGNPDNASVISVGLSLVIGMAMAMVDEAERGLRA
jgi:hypothetical protein